MIEDTSMSEIVGGLDVKQVAKGGTVFEVKHETEEEDASVPPDYLDVIEGFTKLECLDFGSDREPFENLAAKMTNLLENGKIKKRILRQGYGPNPEKTSNVSIHYNAYVQHEAHPFDSTYSRKKPYSFIIGDEQSIVGLEIAVQSMKLNEKSQFLIEPELAFRNTTLGRVPPNSTVLFEIELCDLMKSAANNVLDINEKEFTHVYPFCLAQCVKGKRKFRLKDYQGAIKEYTIAVRKLEEAILANYEEQMKSDELFVRLYTNLLICCTHVQNAKKGCIYAQRIYDIAKDKTFQVTAKVYFNHAKCSRMLGDYKYAERKLNQAKAMEPRNPEILQEYLSLRKAMSEAKQRDTALGKALVSTKE